MLSAGGARADCYILAVGVDDHLNGGKLKGPANLSGLADGANSIARAFRAHTGDSLGGHVRKLRLQRAAAMLGGSEQPIASIALSLGFADQSHLTRMFRAATGFTPAGYRRLCRGP